MLKIDFFRYLKFTRKIKEKNIKNNDFFFNNF